MPSTPTLPAPAGARMTAVDGRTYPLLAVAVDACADGGLATTKLVQRFANPYDEPLEVVYSLPLPADGAVLGYAIRFADTVVRGEVRSRDVAHRDYRDALYAGRTAALVEQDRDDTFRQRLGNVPPRAELRVEIDVLHPLAFVPRLGGEPARWEYRFPLVTGIRYEGAPGRVPDAGRLDVDRDVTGAIPARAEFVLEAGGVDAATAAFASPSHAIAVETGARGARARFTHGERLDRDIVLRWNAGTPELGVRLVEGRGLAGDDGRYALLTVTPPQAPVPRTARDVTVLVDASGSMSGAAIEIAKDVAADVVRSLEPGDRFELLAFANDVRELTRGAVDATPGALADALAALRALVAEGGTEMADAMQRALRSWRRDAQRQVVLVTDGMIGFEAEVIARVVDAARAGTRVHAVGIGAAPNRTLLANVAAAGRGLELFAGDGPGAAEAGRRLVAGMRQPVLTQLALAGTAVRGVAPTRPRDVFDGQPVTIAAELDPAGGTLELRARLAGSDWAWRADVATTAAAAVSALPLGAHYARERIAEVEREDVSKGAAWLDAQVETIALRHRIASRCTSLVAIAEAVAVDPLAPRRTVELPTEVPHGMSAEAAGLGGFGGMAQCFATLDVHEPGPAFARKPAFERRPAYEVHFGEDDATAQPFKSRRPGRVGPPRPPEQRITADVVRVEGDLLVLEFEAFDGCMLPAHDVKARPRPLFARVEPALSSPAGPHRRGQRVKLALRLAGFSTWPTEPLEWMWTMVRPDGVELHVRMTVAWAGTMPGR